MAEEKYSVGEQVLVFYGPALFDAVVLEINEGEFLVHFQGWHKRHDMWVSLEQMNKKTPDNIKYQRELAETAEKHKKEKKEKEEEKKEKAKAKKPKATGEYRTINGILYDRAMLEAAEEAVKGPQDGRISIEDAKKIISAALEDDEYTTVEKRTMKYIRDNFKFTEKADIYTRKAIASWSAHKYLLHDSTSLPVVKVAAPAAASEHKAEVEKIAASAKGRKVPELVAHSLEDIASYYDADTTTLVASEASFKKQLREAFRLFDANHNNKLEKDELAAMLRSMGRRPLKDKIDQIFEILDKNGDGSLDFGEFLSFFKEHYAPIRKEKAAADSETIKAEVATAAAEVKKKKADEEAVEKDLAEGVATALVSGTPLKKEKYAHSDRIFQQQLREVFCQFDKNGNNVITKGELDKALHALGKAPNKKKVDAIFDTLDVDGNGRIDFDEFAKYFREEHTSLKGEEASPSKKRK